MVAPTALEVRKWVRWPAVIDVASRIWCYEPIRNRTREPG